MRPSVGEPGRVLYECFGCGKRERDPDNSVCAKCGSTMRNTGRPRDL